MTYPITTPERDALEAEVIDIVRKLSPDELRVFKFMGLRMVDIGHGKYGALDLDADRRAWTDEIAQETSDRLFYEQCRDIAKAQRRRERIECFRHDTAFNAVDASLSEFASAAEPAKASELSDEEKIFWEAL